MPAASASSVLDSSGERLAAGTVIEAYVEEALCGISSLPPVVMVSGDAGTYLIAVAGPESVPGCASGAPISFRVNGKPVPQTGTNDFAARRHPLTSRYRNGRPAAPSEGQTVA